MREMIPDTCAAKVAYFQALYGDEGAYRSRTGVAFRTHGKTLNPCKSPGAETLEAASPTRRAER